MTLRSCAPDSAALRARLLRQGLAHFGAALALPLHCQSLSVFVEPAEREPFLLVRRFALVA